MEHEQTQTWLTCICSTGHECSWDFTCWLCHAPLVDTLLPWLHLEMKLYNDYSGINLRRNQGLLKEEREPISLSAELQAVLPPPPSARCHQKLLISAQPVTRTSKEPTRQSPQLAPFPFPCSAAGRGACRLTPVHQGPCSWPLGGTSSVEAVMEVSVFLLQGQQPFLIHNSWPKSMANLVRLFFFF